MFATIAEAAALYLFGLAPLLWALYLADCDGIQAQAEQTRGVIISLYGVPVRELAPGSANALLLSGRIISQDTVDDDEDWSE